MIIGIPNESWEEERRVALTPGGAHALACAGHRVLVEAEAGLGCGFSAETYRDAGASIVFSNEEAFARADLVVKVLPPTLEECGWIGEESSLFSLLHMGMLDARVHGVLRDRRTVAVGFELIEDRERHLPVLTAMSEIAGMLLPQIAGRLLETNHGGRGILIGGVAGIPASNVVILGSGTVGSVAAQMFVGLGANVVLLDDDLARLRTVEMLLARKVNTALATPYNIARYVRTADALITAVLIHGRRAPHLVTEAMVRTMRPGGVILDVSIDQGGCVETSRPTTLSDPIFAWEGITHYCVPNIPSSVARTASHALNNVVLPLVEEVAELGDDAFRENPTLRRGVYMHSGLCSHEGLAALLDLEYANIDEIIS